MEEELRPAATEVGKLLGTILSRSNNVWGATDIINFITHIPKDKANMLRREFKVWGLTIQQAIFMNPLIIGLEIMHLPLLSTLGTRYKLYPNEQCDYLFIECSQLTNPKFDKFPSYSPIMKLALVMLYLRAIHIEYGEQKIITYATLNSTGNFMAKVDFTKYVETPQIWG